MSNQIVVHFAPPSPNELRRKYRTPLAYMRLRKNWEEALFYGVGSGRQRAILIEQAQNRRMRARITIYHRREFDPDNLVGCLKPVLDALRVVGYIHDDSSEWLELILPPGQERTLRTRDNKTEIWLEAV